MAIEIRDIVFRRPDLADVVAAMVALDERGDGAGWVNFHPHLTDTQRAELPASSGSWFSGRGPAVATGTWMPERAGRRPRPAQVGLEHGTGPHALDRLATAGLALPSGWHKRQDHAKNGIVAELPAAADPATVVEWLVQAGTALSPVVEPTQDWVALVHEPA